MLIGSLIDWITSVEKNDPCGILCATLFNMNCRYIDVRVENMSKQACHRLNDRLGNVDDWLADWLFWRC